MGYSEGTLRQEVEAHVEEEGQEGRQEGQEGQEGRQEGRQEGQEREASGCIHSIEKACREEGPGMGQEEGQGRDQGENGPHPSIRGLQRRLLTPQGASLRARWH